jgi:hypothetical protein
VVFRQNGGKLLRHVCSSFLGFLPIPCCHLYQNFSSDVDVFFGAGCVDAREEEIVSCEEREKDCPAEAVHCFCRVQDACQEGREYAMRSYRERYQAVLVAIIVSP